MINPIMTVLRQLIPLIPFALLLFVNKRVNLKQEERSKQFLMPLLALLYGMILVILMTRISNGLLDWLRELPALLLRFAGWISLVLSGHLAFLGSLARALANALNGVLEGGGVQILLFSIENALFLVIHFILKRALLSVMKRVFKTGNSIYEYFANLFYSYDQEKQKWFLGPHSAMAADFLRVGYRVACVVSVLAAMLTVYLFRQGAMTTLFYPVFGVIVIGELYFFVDGEGKRKDREDIDGEGEDGRLLVNYALLRPILRKLFGDKLSAENTTMDSKLLRSRSNEELLAELEERGDPKTDSYAKFMRGKMSRGMELDQDYLLSGLELLNGRSILFNDPFYYDLIPYAFYPMNRAMLRHRKVLIVLGRHGIEGDIAQWCDDGLRSVTNIPGFWRIGVLNGEAQELDVGIVTRSSVHDLDLHEANEAFFREVEFVVLIEPSKLITTAQIGLNSLVRYCRKGEEKQIVFCSTDKNCNGLVDALSHILLTSLEEVSATSHHHGVSSYMCWDADDDRLQHRMLPHIAHYLGVGPELSFVALKHQVSHAEWFGGDAFPVVDMQWIVRQYYFDLLNYANLPATQEAIDTYFSTSANLWNAQVRKNHYMSVEDESFNMFEAKRLFATRASEQGFVNLITTEYLLRDYMAENEGIFNADPKAVPYIVADYARTLRNVALRLCLQMSSRPVCEEDLRRELMLVDAEEGGDLLRSFWRTLCESFQTAGQIRRNADGEEVLACTLDGSELEFEHRVIRTRRRFSLEKGKMEQLYFIDDPAFIRWFLSDLQSAEYIAEDEKGHSQYLGSELRGQVLQKYLPGQFFVFDGKYYEMQRLTSGGQVLVRRAADHIQGRPTYRQERRYFLSYAVDSAVMGDCVELSGLKITLQNADIRVETPAYWQMDRYNDFVGGKRVTINGVPERYYRNKQLLRIDFSGCPGVTGEILNTLSLLMNEIFRTLFAENQGFIAAVRPGEAAVPSTFSLFGENGFAPDDQCIYIIEDSQLDIGLLIAVRRNLSRILTIACDYLDWHMEALEASLHPPESPTPPEYAVPQEGDGQAEEKPAKKKGPLGRAGEKVKGFFRKLFGRRKKKPGADGGDGAPETPAGSMKDPWQMDGGESGPEAPATAAPEGEELAKAPAGDGSGDPNDKFKGDDVRLSLSSAAPGTAVQADGAEPVPDRPEGETIEMEPEAATRVGSASLRERRPYHLRHYLLYGGTAVPEQLDVPGTAAFLKGLGFDNNELEQARKGKSIAKLIEEGYDPSAPGKHFCDFCGAELSGTEYEVLQDGRERCLQCGRTAVKSAAEFTALYKEVLKNMALFYGVKINVPVTVKMVSAKQLYKRMGKTFVPTSGFDSRAVGVAILDRGGYSLYVENGAPRLKSVMTMAHELTHIWQYTHWDMKQITRMYGSLEQEVYEGMAKWVEIQYAYLINEPATAKREEILTSLREDEYGRGFLKYCSVYPISEGTELKGLTPFDHPEKPL